MENKTELIQYLINKFNYQSYLEIGVAAGDTYNKINIQKKIGVDPNPKYQIEYPITSSEFFKQNIETFDIIFIDGMHLSEVVYDDIQNSLKILNDGGTIICHDMWPTSDITACHDPNYCQGYREWYGDCYKGLLKVLRERDDLWVHVLYDFDCGTTIIRKSNHNKYLKKDIPNWNINVETWHKEAFRLKIVMSIDEYLKKSEETVICAIAKQENDYLEEWCRHHFDLGFDRIYLYDNNDIDGEKYDWLLEKFPNLEIRNIRGLKAQQILQYKSFCQDNIYKWVAYIDIDEYIRIDKYNNIKEFLDSFPDTDVYILQWQCYKANHNILPIDKPLYEYITEKLPDCVRKDSRYENMNGWYKSISKSGKLLDMNEHTVWGNNLKVRDCLGNETNSVWFKYRNHSQDTVWVDHFIIKNIREYYYKKYLRGHAGLDMDATDGYTWWNWNQNLNYYNDIQGLLSETEQGFLRSRGFKPNWTFRPMIDVMMHMEPHDTPWYSKRKVDLVQNMLSYTDCRMVLIGEPNIPAEINNIYGAFSFMSSNMYHNYGKSSWMLKLPNNESYGQPILVFNLGYDSEVLQGQYNENEQLQILNNTMNSFFRNSKWLQDRMHDIIENPAKMIVVKGSVKIDENCGGYKDIVDKFLNERGYQNKHLKIVNNMYLTSKPIYDLIFQYWCEYANQYGLDNYTAWQFIYPSLVKKLEIL